MRVAADAGVWNVLAEDMSEFKYACPVCGQHIKCDSSQGGSVMQCPTCFQKIIAPQAPATNDPKFILKGTKVGERAASSAEAGRGMVIASTRKVPGMVVVLVIIVLIATAAGFIYHGTLFNSTPRINPADTNWTLNLSGVTIPGAAATGRIHGREFVLQRAVLRDGKLMLRGTNGLGVSINFSGTRPEALSEQSINVTANVLSAARVALRWKEGDHASRTNFTSGYALRLKFDPLKDHRLPGEIYLCTPDAGKSYVMGTFDAAVRTAKPEK
jgi:DNA-directed RNA polymerase subunit RPC12/RpoP